MNTENNVKINTFLGEQGVTIGESTYECDQETEYHRDDLAYDTDHQWLSLFIEKVKELYERVGIPEDKMLWCNTIKTHYPDITAMYNACLKFMSDVEDGNTVSGFSLATEDDDYYHICYQDENGFYFYSILDGEWFESDVTDFTIKY